MKHALILHGAANNSSGNWFPWLKKELEERGYTVWCPDLPHADEPKLLKWKAFILENSQFIFDKETLIIGHSSGATFILGLLEALPKCTCVGKAILVAPFIELGERTDIHQYKKGLLKNFDWKKIQKKCKRFYFIASDNDPYLCGIDQSQILQGQVGGEVKLVSGQGHFNLEQSEEYKQFPLLLSFLS